MAVCKNCGSTISNGQTVCSSCGQAVSSGGDTGIICLSCNTVNPIGTHFCKGCGAVLIKKQKAVQCAVCGSDNPPDALFCTTCGSAMPGEVELDFESESINKLKTLIPEIMAYKQAIGDPYAGASSADIEKMTYICPACGKRNNLSDDKCKRCGRDRKRTAELASKGLVPTFEEAVCIPDAKFAPTPVELPSLNSMPKHEFKKGKPSADCAAVFGGMSTGYNGYGQMSPIVQPIAIVPYVSQEQPLWQTATEEEIAEAAASSIDK